MSPCQAATTLRHTVVDKRNFLAHYFWFERAHLMFSVENIHQMIEELDQYTELFNRLDEQTSRWFESKRRELGLTDEMIQECQSQILSGQLGEPLPDKQTVRELERKLNRRQRLIRVWEFTLDDGKRTLVFELVDGSLWQLCDVGLGWTRFQEIGPNWTEHPTIKPYLPADILPRPKDASPWDYEFSLSKGAVFWVKPGRQEQTFKWGVKTS